MDKQIDEMTKIMNECCNRYDEQGNHLGNKCYECEEWCDTNHICCSYNRKEAEALYNAGYRKASDVAEEIFAEIEEIRLKHIKKCEFFRNGSTEEMERKFYEGAEWGLRQLSHWIAELKKKYTEGEG